MTQTSIGAPDHPAVTTLEAGDGDEDRAHNKAGTNWNVLLERSPGKVVVKKPRQQIAK
jgi:hypothetical protein